MGGLDIFKAVKQPGNNQWRIENMGFPVNLLADDFGITMGIGFLLIGIFQLIATLSIRHQYGWSWIYFSISMLMIIAGIILFTNPFAGAETILIFIGIFLLIYGVAELYMAWKLSKKPTIYDDNQIEIE
jgi:uncharacterized membrane protein HdeD (DUF308 family)